jgi:hypothetical protein
VAGDEEVEDTEGSTDFWSPVWLLFFLFVYFGL